MSGHDAPEWPVTIGQNRRSRWTRIPNLVSNLPTDIVLPPEVRDWLQVLHARKELPAWTKAYRCLDEGLPIRGWVTAVKRSFCSVELDIGLVAVWPNGRNSVRRAKGLESSFFVQTLNPDKDFVQVGLDKPVSLIVSDADGLAVGGIYEGHVTGVKDYGVFLRIDDRRGLLHRSKLSVNTDVLAHFSVGQSFPVQVTKIRPDGKLELSLPTH